MNEEYIIQAVCINCNHITLNGEAIYCPIHKISPSFIGWCPLHKMRKNGIHPSIQSINIDNKNGLGHSIEALKQYDAKYEYYWMGDYDSLNTFLKEHAETYEIQRHGSFQRLIYNDITYDLHGSCWLVITNDGKFEVRR